MTCPFCTNEIKEGALVCKYCKRNIVPLHLLKQYKTCFLLTLILLFLTLVQNQFIYYILGLTGSGLFRYISFELERGFYRSLQVFLGIYFIISLIYLSYLFYHKKFSIKLKSFTYTTLSIFILDKIALIVKITIHYSLYGSTFYRANHAPNELFWYILYSRFSLCVIELIIGVVLFIILYKNNRYIFY